MFCSPEKFWVPWIQVSIFNGTFLQKALLRMASGQEWVQHANGPLQMQSETRTLAQCVDVNMWQQLRLAPVPAEDRRRDQHAADSFPE